MPRSTKGESKKGTRKRSVVFEALGPAATEFGREVRPLGREVGAVTVRAVRALLKPVGALVWGFEKVEDWIATTVAPKLQKIPEESRIEPKLAIAGPTIDAMKYYGSEPDLADLFANLLVTSMDRRVASTAHPAFVEIIKQLSPDEARMLRLLTKRISISYPVLYALRCSRPQQYESKQLKVMSEFGPYSLLGRYSGCKNLELVPVYLTNLVRLELINVIRNAQRKKTQMDEALLDDPLIERLRRRIEDQGDEFRYTTGTLFVTPLGDKFLDACIGEGMHSLGIMRPE